MPPDPDKKRNPATDCQSKIVSQLISVATGGPGQPGLLPAIRSPPLAHPAPRCLARVKSLLLRAAAWGLITGDGQGN